MACIVVWRGAERPMISRKQGVVRVECRSCRSTCSSPRHEEKT